MTPSTCGRIELGTKENEAESRCEVEDVKPKAN